METKARHFIVGIGVIALFLCFAASTLLYVGDTTNEELTKYAIYFKEQSVSGLQVGSPITMRGIRIGEVSSIGILTEEVTGARVEAKIQSSIPILSRNRAVVERNLLTGLASIELQTVQEPLEVHRKAPPSERLPLIFEGEGEVEKIKVSLTETVSNLNSTLTNIQNLLNEDTRKTLVESIQNLERLTATLASESESVQETIAKTNKLLDSSKQLVGTITTTSKVIGLEAALISKHFRQAADRVSSTIEEYKDPRKLLRGPSAETLGPGEGR
jgi:phospholipid/cholesterol/gamma-HCH transport system substrate-binding protein